MVQMRLRSCCVENGVKARGMSTWRARRWSGYIYSGERIIVTSSSVEMAECRVESVFGVGSIRFVVGAVVSTSRRIDIAVGDRVVFWVFELSTE